MLRIVIDAGHGGYDSGAVNTTTSIKEKDINLQIATCLNQKLLRSGYYCHMTRDKDQYVSLEDRAALSNKLQANAFISIHCNSSENKQVTGMEIWTSPGFTSADMLATYIGEELMATFPYVPMRHDYSDGDLDKEGKLYVLMKTVCPAVLLECGFISNDQEAILLKTLTTAHKLAYAISFGISRWNDRKF